MDKIETMRAFALVAQEGSFTGAARRLGVSTKLVSKYVQRLEDQLETRLFNRTTRSVSLTDIGTVYLEQCRPIVEQIDELDLLVKERQSTLAGPIRITAPTGFGSTKLTEALIPFLQAHRAVEVELVLSDRRIAVVEEGFDLAIRIGALRDSTLIAKKLSDMPLVICASPAYLDAHGRPPTPRELATHDCLIEDNQSDPTAWQFHKGEHSMTVKISSVFRANSPGAVARMAVGGLGIARLPRYTVEEMLADNRLETVLPDCAIDMFGLYALYPPNRHLTRRVRALIDHLGSVLHRW